MRSYFFLSVFSISKVLGTITSIRSKLPTAVCLSREGKRGNCEANLLYIESDFGTTELTDKSFTVFAVEALNLIIESKSQPVELDHSRTIELHVPSRRKKSLQSYCSLDFDFLPLMWFNMTFDVTLRDDLVSVRVIKTSHFHFYW